MKKKKSKKFLIRRILAIFILLILVVISGKLVQDLSNKNQQKQTRLLYNNELVSLIHPIQQEDGVIYLSEEDVKTIFDDTIYYNVGDKELITTFNKHVAVLHLEETQMLVNDSNIQMQGKLKEFDSQIYLPLTDLEIVYDIETEYAKNTNMVIMDSTTKAKSRVMAMKKTKVKARKGPFAKTLETVKPGEYLYVIAEEGNLQKVRTTAGNLGYVKSKKVFNKEVLREDWAEKKVENSDFENTDEMFIINQENTKVTNTSTAFATYAQRNKVINEVYAAIIQNGKYAVCIDFQEIDDIHCFYRFVIELTPKLRESGMKVALKLNQQIEEEKMKNVVDVCIREDKK